MRPSEVDLALVYDGFTFNAISWLEGLGFCGFGEAYDWLDGGRRIALDGELPVNPHGGQLSEGRTHGFGFLYEAVQQLRHDAGERQVARRQDRRRHLRRRHPVGRAPPAASGTLSVPSRTSDVRRRPAGDGTLMGPPTREPARKEKRRVDDAAAHGEKAQWAPVPQGGRDTGAARRRRRRRSSSRRFPRRPHLRHRRAGRPLARILLPLLRIEGRGLPRGRGRGGGAPQRAALQRHPRPVVHGAPFERIHEAHPASTSRATATRPASWA